MELSLAGLIVIVMLLLIGWAAGATILIALMCAIPFGATAWGSLPALGGSSPQIYTVFALLLVGRVVSNPQAILDLRVAFGSHWIMPLIAGITAYTLAGSIVYPRVFIGQTSAFVPIKGAIFEVPLSPVAGNITQSAYFALGALCCIALAADLHRRRNYEAVIKACYAWCATNALLGIIDFCGKLVGLTDILAPIRTASYSYLTASMEHNFWRIAGGFSEASAFAGNTIACVAFAFAYWRETGARIAIVLCAANLALLVLSTSTTAYVALALVCLPVLASLLVNVSRANIARRELHILLLGLGVVALSIAVVVMVPKVAQPFIDMLDYMVLRKGESSSAQERGYWNQKSIESAIDTFGLGVGLGSSRASSWIIAVISQLGVAGALGFTAIIYAVLRAPIHARAVGIKATTKPAGLIRGARAAAFATIVSGSISGAAADPGMTAFLFFAIAITTAPALVSRNRQKRTNAGTTRSPNVVTTIPHAHQA